MKWGRLKCCSSRLQQEFHSLGWKSQLHRQIFLRVSFPSFAWSITFPDDWENLLCALPAGLLAGGFTLVTYHSRAVRCVNCTLQLWQMNFQFILIPSYYYFMWILFSLDGRGLGGEGIGADIPKCMNFQADGDSSHLRRRSSCWWQDGASPDLLEEQFVKLCRRFFQLWSLRVGFSTSVSWIKGTKHLRGRREGRGCFIPWLLTFWFLTESQCSLYCWQQEG